MLKYFNKGFTLIELLVATSLFVIVLGFGFSLYVSITKVQQSNMRANRVYAESRYWVDQLVEEIESNEINYDTTVPYPINVPETSLQLVDDNGTVVSYYLSDLDSDGIDDTLQRNIGGTTTTLSSPEIRVTDLDVYIDPLIVSETDAPKVTIIWKAQDSKLTDPENIAIQTTVSLRNY